MSPQDKRFWMSNAAIAAGLSMALFFPTDDGWQSLVSKLAFLVVLPIIFIRVFLKESVSSFGITWGDVTKGSLWLGISLIAVVAFLAGVLRYTDALSSMSVPLPVRSSFLLFLSYVVLFGIYLFIYEFFFRGFVLSVWEKKIGYKAIFLQAVLAETIFFSRTHWHIDHIAFIVAILMLCAGWIALQSRSVWYSFFFLYISVILEIIAVIVFVK